MIDYLLPGKRPVPAVHRHGLAPVHERDPRPETTSASEHVVLVHGVRR